MTMLGCVPPIIPSLSLSNNKSNTHQIICSKPISYQNLTMLELAKENLNSFANGLRIMEKVDLETAVDCSAPCTKAVYNVKISSSETADFKESWMNIAFLDEIQGY